MPTFKEWFNKVSIGNKDLHYKLFVVFGQFFIIPGIGVIYFALKYDISRDVYFAPFMLVLLVFLFFGFRLLRKMFDNIRNISASFSQTVEETTKNGLNQHDRRTRKHCSVLPGARR